MATDDIMSVVSEGMTAGLPVYVWGDPERRPTKFRAFFDRMEREGRLTVWGGALSLPAPARALNDADQVAVFIRARWTALAKPTERV